MKKHVLLCLLLTAVAFAAGADSKVKRPETYNYNRGLEVLNDGDYEEATRFFRMDAQDNSKSGYPHAWLQMLYLKDEEYGRALAEAEKALKLLPKNDKEFISAAYRNRAKTYLAMEDTVKALADYATAIKTNPEQTDCYTERAQIYYEQQRYDLSDADYQKAIDIDKSTGSAYIGLGRNAYAQKHYDEAVAHYDEAVKLFPNYSSAYSFRAQALRIQAKYANATSDIVHALDIDDNDMAYGLLFDMNEPAYRAMKAQLKLQIAKTPNEGRWNYYLGQLEQDQNHLIDAIDAFQKSNSIDASPYLLGEIADCYANLGDYHQALDYVDRGLMLDSTFSTLLMKKAEILHGMGRMEAAIGVLDEGLADRADWANAYLLRGRLKAALENYNDAIDDFTMAITLYPEHPFPFISRGRAYQHIGNEALAAEDFNAAIALEPDTSDYALVPFAHLGLGDRQKAMECLDIMLKNSAYSYEGDTYQAACVYSLIGEPDSALHYLRKSLDLGYADFLHIDTDEDLDALRKREDFQQLVAEYRRRCGEVPPAEQETAYGQRDTVKTTTEVPFTKEYGVTSVKCSINGLPLQFVFDTGAATVHISQVEATFMMKNGYLTRNDVIGASAFQDATGSVSVGTIINLRKVEFGGFTLDNVRASVARNQQAPLLLGQTVLGRLGKVEIDNDRQVLRITQF